VKNGGSSNYFEYAIDLMLEKHDVYAVDISDFPSIEIDTKEDLEQAQYLAKNFH
jgi:choline kinase